MPSLLPGEEGNNAVPSPASGPPMPSSSKQTPSEENVALLDGLSVENVTNTLLRSILAETALTWPFELFNLVRNSAPLIVGFLLQHSLTLASVFSAGQLGKDELAAVSLATITANLTGYALYQGFVTALETLCAQSYGAGQYTEVGLHLQRCVILLMLTSVPIGCIWMSSPSILGLIVQEKKVVELAGGYLRILFLGAPGYALFEAGKRYMQAQSIPHASTAVLAFLAPLNAFMNFALVSGEFLGLGFGFYGAPAAVVITNWLMPLCLAYYAIFIEGSKCWHPLTLRVFTNWESILSLTLPGIAMIWSEFISVELLTLFSSYFGTSTMAAHAILATMMSFIYQLPFGMSLSSCNAVAQYVGAGNITSARRSAYVAMGIAIVFGVIDCVALIAMFSRDKEVIAFVAEALPVCAAFQVVDVLASGQGRQRIAGIVKIPAYYGLAIPLGWGIRGLWAGCTCALAVVAMVQTVAKVDMNSVGDC
ncbi:MATE efflux family protein [Terfezia boudieri ATCC MYA-4762]|uniref:MATE efflux family protein n=1 Tax=Terfezia boudieri ATCC MYA-4762 TaxID=1051890 RepID=A0A3N4LPV3_9PEZI|nr:MATE efflux family protein [Terfezia boudieri ATCC MYA-4762]